MRNLLFCLIIFVLGFGVSWADSPLAGGIGARPLALGSAYVGLANDCSAIFTNPAGISEIKNKSYITMYSQPGTSISFTSLGGVFPDYLSGNIALAIRNRTIGNIQVTTSEVADYTDQDISLLYAKKIREFLFLGINYRLLSKGLSKTISGFEGSNGSGSALDLGLKYIPRPFLSWGLALQSINGKLTYQDGSQEDITGKITLGSSFKIGGYNAYFKNIEHELLFNFDISKPLDQSASSLHLGGELWPNDYIAIRLGIEQEPKTVTESYTNTSAGFGIEYKGFTFDFAYRKLGGPSGASESFISINYLDQSGPKPKATKEVIAILPLTKETVVTRKIKRVQFSDIPEGHWAKNTVELLATAGLISGYPDGTFNPHEKLTRIQFSLMLLSAKNISSADPANEVGGLTWKENPDKFVRRSEAAELLELKKEISDPQDIITRMGFAVMLAQTYYGQAALKRLPPLHTKEKTKIKGLLHFNDVPENYWAKEAISYLTTLGILNYFPDGSFSPEQPISRAELVMLLAKAKKYKLSTKLKKVFKDVPIKHWAASYIQSAQENKLTLGYPDKTFKPKRLTSRLEGIIFTTRFANLALPLEINQASPFSDISSTHWGIKEVLAAMDDKVIQYFLKQDNLNPNLSLTRAELADILFQTEYVKQKIKEHFKQ